MTTPFRVPEPSKQAEAAFGAAWSQSHLSQTDWLRAAYAVDLPRIVREEVERALTLCRQHCSPTNQVALAIDRWALVHLAVRFPEPTTGLRVPKGFGMPEPPEHTCTYTGDKRCLGCHPPVVQDFRTQRIRETPIQFEVAPSAETATPEPESLWGDLPGLVKEVEARLHRDLVPYSTVERNFVWALAEERLKPTKVKLPELGIEYEIPRTGSVADAARRVMEGK